jgi:indolepyruvate ferredoxin oxidoreductase
MAKRQASLSDKFDLSERRLLLTGTQAVVRLALMQKARDRLAGLNTAGYVTGYRGSPIATLESAFERAQGICEANDILFHPGLNEDLAATAIWGSQQAELRGEGRYDGVFAVWYGKGPGVDRSGDAFRHANHAGTSRHGGVLALMGDDHTCESSTSAHQSEFAFVDAMIPVLNPAGVQEIIDYGLLGFGLSRFAGVWVGLKCVKDNIESTATVDGRLDRVEIKLPTETEFQMPLGGLNIRLGDQPLAKEARLHDFKRAAILTFARANGLDRIVISGGSRPRLGIITAGKSYLDVRQALDELGIDEVRANALGIRLYKVAMSWPLEPRGVARFAEGLETILVVEEKRSLIETQVKEQLFDAAVRPRVLGKRDEAGHWLFPAKGALDPLDIALAIGRRLLILGHNEGIAARVRDLECLTASRPVEPEVFTRVPYFCAGCPHNTSTVVPQGSRAYAGIGCHYMALWMDRSTEGFTQMGGEGANWIGEAPFSRREHVFQNIGDGTYIHSGSLAIRAAVAAGVNITFKLLYNDAVAMTGGQKLDGGMTVGQMAAQALAEGVERVDVVTDEPGKYGHADLPPGVAVYDRRDLDAVQRACAATKGVTVLIYDQTCAAEKRRRRKRGTYPDPDKRVLINPLVCEGCGDCGKKSNCVAVVPLDTELGRKRAIDQSACNKDFSCLEGFCPSFVTLHGATVRKADSPPPSWGRVRAGGTAEQLPLGSPPPGFPPPGFPHPLTPPRKGKGDLSEPALPRLDRPYAVLVTGVGGTGVVTVSAVLGQAAHLAGLGFGAIDVTGLAQKGGAVACHMRIAAAPEDIHAIRVGTGHADLVLGGDLVVTASNKILDCVRPGHTAVVYSTYEMTTGDFARNPRLEVPGGALNAAIRARAGAAPVDAIDAHEMSVALLGDSIFANMLLLGFAFQLGRVPVPAASIEEAILLNGAAVEKNVEAFRLGRLAAADPCAMAALTGHEGDSAAKAATPEERLADTVAYRAAELAAYQNGALAERYRAKVQWMANLERERTPGRFGLAEAVAKSYFKLLAYKDEYEVARLFSDGRFERLLANQFEGVRRIEFHLAPPLLARRRSATGEPIKMRFGPWMLRVFRLLAKGKRLRGTRWDLFGYSSERRRERQMIADYERLIEEIGERLSPATHATAVALAALPQVVCGFGHVKARSHDAALALEARLLAELRHPAPVRVAAE